MSALLTPEEIHALLHGLDENPDETDPGEPVHGSSRSPNGDMLPRREAEPGAATHLCPTCGELRTTTKGS